MPAEQKEVIGDHMVIFKQMGGNKFLTMTGSKPLYHHHDKDGYVFIAFKLKRNLSKATYFKIQYKWNDLYDMEFSRIKKTLNKEYYSLAGRKIYDEEPEIVKVIKDVYAEDLQQIFTSVTGLYTKLF
jgi:hypothetical protein